MSTVSSTLFKAYDIRGVVDTALTPDAVRLIGMALGSEAVEGNNPAICVGRDGRLSGPLLRDALVAGITSTGTSVVDVGMVPTPVLYFSTVHLGTGSGVEITGSHNPPEYNGLKMMLAGTTLHGDAIQALRSRIESGNLVRAKTPGEERMADVLPAYLERIHTTVKLARPMTIAIDCGNGVAGPTAVALFRALGCEVVELYTDIDGTFPNHHPDPAHPENLEDLIRALRETDAEVGLAFDGDGDRLGVVTKHGQIIYPDRQIMLFARDILAANPGGEIIFDVKCTRRLAPWIREHGGRPTMWRTGHSLVKAKLKETGAPFAGEMSGHLFFNDRWPGFDDGLVRGCATARDPVAQLGSLCGPECLALRGVDAGTAFAHGRRRKLCAGRTIEVAGHVQRRGSTDHDRRRACRVVRWLRPGAAFEHHSGGRAALRR